MGKKKQLIYLRYMIQKQRSFISLKNFLKIENFSSISTLAKKDIHPNFFPEAKVLCNGKLVMTVGGSLEEYIVDIWSGNHPFFQGVSNNVIVDEGQVNRFKKKFSGLEKLGRTQINK